MKWRFLFGLLSIAVVVSCNKTTPVVPATVRLEYDIEAIDQYLLDHGITDAVEDTTGIRYVVHKLGTGVTPKSTDCIRISYTGRLLSDETEFDSNTNLKYHLSGFIPGWRYAFQHLPQGSVATLYIPSGWAYGSTAQTNIPANSILIFDVELFDVYAYNSSGGYCYPDPLILPELQLQKDVAFIDKYLLSNSISAETDPSGIRYTIQSLGTGPKPTTANCVKVKYKGSLLSTRTVFDENTTGYKAPLVRLIKGWQSGLPLLPKGTKATLYIPSGLAYGPTGSGSRIPSNANLIFEVEILDVTDYNATLDYCN